MTSTPVLESNNRYAALSVESTNDNDNDLDLCTRDDRHDTGDAVATKRDVGRQDPYTIEGRMPLSQDLKSKVLSPLSSGTVREHLKGPSQSPARAQEKVEANNGLSRLSQATQATTGHRAESPTEGRHKEAARCAITRATPGPRVGIKMWPLTSEGTGETGKPAFMVQAQPDTLPESRPPTRSVTCNGTLIPKEWDEDHQECPLKVTGDAKATAMKKIAAGQEAASAQAVNRGHKVTLIEVPNEEDDTAFLIWMAHQKEAPPIVEDSRTKCEGPSLTSPLSPTTTRG
ncbi:hypothetical protein ARMSODRAFT_1026722 [Armillaria solidipes]|uniref:Uncharacterized protein n=1 Tax=Armillaria solidipes TaxID=1076256 RepID=A0A2H3ANB7_9AGAR|nr:hypothetical protein ARMSODRAFT_1026722 [Armillaria solidipes]